MVASRGAGISDDDICPVCQTDRYLNPHMKLLVGPCFHKMCDNCIERLFAHGPAPCPTCRQTLRKAAFSEQTFEDLGVEKEVRIRRQMAQKFNKRLEDFKTLKAFNDYLEEVEDMTFKLVNEIDVEATKLAIEKFSQENRDLIRMNADRLLEESRWASYMQEQQRKERAARREADRNELKAEEAAKAEERKNFIQELATSDKSAKTIVAQRQHQVTLKKTSMRRMDANTHAAGGAGTGTGAGAAGAKGSPSLGAGGNNGSTALSSSSAAAAAAAAAANGTAALSMSEAYWKAQEEALRSHMQPEEEDDMDIDFDPIQSQYLDVDLGAGYVQSVNHNMPHGGGLQYPLLTSSTGIRDLYTEPWTMERVYVRAGGYRPIFGYTRAIEDAHTALFENAL
ncbi:TFIIH/NER complex subunit [Actinomortierella ambigua]|nr:TFIIH/NER complex subunit [Actinomortierella ambigua]